MNRILLCAMFFLCSGCCPNEPLRYWLAKQDVPIYDTHVGEGGKVLFVVHRGDVCIPGEVVVEKMFQYTEVLCPNKGYGWTADDSRFDELTKQIPKLEKEHIPR